MTRATNLRIDDRVIARSDEGPFEVEYALFDAGEIELRANGPASTREVGYLTTAGDALERLEEHGVTLALAQEAAASFTVEIVDAYARGRVVRDLIAQLGAYELFEGGVFRASTGLYDGAWLDLRALATELKIPRAGLALQALHLAAALNEVDADASVFLVTDELTAEERPSARTHRRVSLDHARKIPAALHGLRTGVGVDARWTDSEPSPEGPLREELQRLVRERVMGGAREAQRDRLSALDLGLGAQIAPPRGPLADPELWAIERQLMAGDTRGVDERIDAVEQARGKTLATRYLRARAALASGKEAPRSIAVGLSEMAASEDTFHELELLTARAWLAAGEHAHARYYARALVENPGAPDEIRLVGVEILEATPSSRRPQLPLPPPPRAPTPVPIKPNAIISIAPPPLAHAAPPGASRPPYACEALGFELEAMPRIPQAARLPQTDLAMFPPARERSSRDTPIIDTTATVVHEQTPLPRPQAPRDIPSARPSHHGRYDAEMVVSRDRYVPEAVESLLYPVGLDPNEPKVGVVPRTPAEARVAFTRMARELGLNYRLWYGTSLRTDTLAIDAMQRHLQLRWSDGEAHGPEVLWELQRHGALLSEILARALGAVWVDVAPTELGYWAMVVPPATRVWPFGRLFRFLTVGHSENDLVSYYLELDARAKSARAREDEE